MVEKNALDTSGTNPAGVQSTRAGVEQALVALFCVVRAALVLPSLYAVLIRSLATGVSRELVLSVLTGIAAESVLLGSWLIRRGSVRAGRAPWVIDLCVVVPALVTVALCTPLDQRQQPWSTGVCVVALSTAALVGLTVSCFAPALLCGLGLAAVHVLSEATPLLTPWSMVVTACTGALAYPLASVLTWFFAGVVRGLADEADDDLERVAVLERERSRATIHNLLPLLRPPSTSRGSGPASQVPLDASTVYQRMRAFVDSADPQLPPSTGPSRSRSIVPQRALRRRVGNLPIRTVSTHKDVEWMLAFGFVACRVVCLVMVLTGTVIISLVSPSSDTTVALVLVAVALESTVVGRRLLRSGELRCAARTAWIDLFMNMTMLVIVMVSFPPGSRPSTWYLWVFTVPLSAAGFVALTLRSERRVVMIGLALGVAHSALFMVLAWNRRDLIVATAGDSWEYLGVAMSVWLFATTIRKLATVADSARERVAQLERERNRTRVHELLPYLSSFAGSDVDPAARTALQRQDQAKYLRLKAYVEGVAAYEDLGSRLHGVLELHPELLDRTTVDLNLDLLLDLSEEVLDRLVLAVDTALANVEQNAPGASVALTATCTEQTVTVSVRDDGPGFDIEKVPLGFGITRILGTHLREVGGYGSVQSAPGHGTQVVIEVPRRSL